MGPTRILLVDDNEDLLHSLSRVFQKAGFAVTTAPDAETAIESLGATAPDVVLTDLRLPGQSGLDVLRAVRALFPRVPVLIVTAYGDDDTRAAADQLGAFALLSKPMMRGELLAVVDRALTAAAA